MKKRINSRAKGARGERGIANLLREAGFVVSRNARNGLSAPDLDCSQDPVLCKFHPEVKNSAVVDLHTKGLLDAWKQADECRQPNQIPIVFWNKSRVGWFLTWAIDVGTAEPVLASTRAVYIPATLRWLAK